MKRILLLIVCLFLITGCNKEEEIIEKEPEVKTVEYAYTDDNPITVGLYQNGVLVHDISAYIADRTDITSVDVYFTNETNVGSSNTKYNYNRFLANYSNLDLSRYKVGYHVSFKANGKTVEELILDPSSMLRMAPYMFVYLYDDVHQADGAWYSHVEEDEVSDDTIYSSIKLFAATQTNEIESPIVLTVFTYDGMDDFDESGHYRGNSKYSININRR